MHSVEPCGSIPYPPADICSTRATLRRTHAGEVNESPNAMQRNLLKRLRDAVRSPDERGPPRLERGPQVTKEIYEVLANMLLWKRIWDLSPGGDSN